MFSERMSSQDAPILFLDLSHYVFHRYFAIQTWCNMRKQTFEDTPEGRAAFLEKFEKLFESNIVTFKKKNKVEWKNVYLVKDTSRETIWRMKHYPLYKKNRDERNIKFDPSVFTHVYDVLIPRLVDTYGLKVIGYQSAEADDVIAVLHRKIRADPDTKDKKVIVITNDNDYLQLNDERTLIVNCNNKELKDRFSKDELDHFTLWKVIKGDDSDNIPSIDKKIGDKIALKLAMDGEMLKAKLESCDEVKARFELNNMLINFEQIPNDIVDGIMKITIE